MFGQTYETTSTLLGHAAPRSGGPLAMVPVAPGGLPSAVTAQGRTSHALYLVPLTFFAFYSMGDGAEERR